MTTYAIPTGNLPRLAQQVARLNKRAARLGVAPLVYVEGATWCRFVTEPSASNPTGWRIKRSWEVTEIDLDGGSIHLDGWTFVGTIEHLVGENLLRAVPGEVIPETFRTGTQACDHCGLDRRRADTFVVRNLDGVVKQLGRGCVADYLGHVDPARLASFLEAVTDLTRGGEDDDDEHDPRGARDTFRPDDLVAIAIGATHKYGWLSRAASGREQGGIATAARVTAWLRGGKGRRELEDDGMVVTAEDFAQAEVALDWARAQVDATEYIANLRVLAKQERVDGKALGLLASLPATYARAMETAAEKAARDAARAKQREAADPALTGKVEVTGEVVGVKEQASDYGVQYKMTVLTAGGWRVFVTIPSSISEVAIGQRVRFTATLEAAANDPTMAWGKRPTRAVIIEAEA